eukprot:TRINITY_DN958_c0_g1_i1.p1 TRINITY_DN958_c0_g1~~TRINITY_DN958_c0_g1_i1.p1  ORF type:complete len:458 (-),score=93.03 TRINITY_DN958_c0_g1_i1:94-1467(-)
MADPSIDVVAASLVSALHSVNAKDGLPTPNSTQRKRKTPKRRADGEDASTEDEDDLGGFDFMKRISDLMQKTDALSAKLPKKMRIATVAFLPGTCKASGTPLLANVLMEAQELIESNMVRRSATQEELSNIVANIPYLAAEEAKRPTQDQWRPINERYYSNMYPGELFTKLTAKIRAFLKLGNGSAKPNYKQAELMRSRLPFYPDDVPCVKPGKHQVSETVALHVALDNHYQMVKFVEDHGLQFVPPLHEFTRQAWKAALLLCEQNDFARLQTEGFVQPKLHVLEGQLQIAKQQHQQQQQQQQQQMDMLTPQRPMRSLPGKMASPATHQLPSAKKHRVGEAGPADGGREEDPEEHRCKKCGGSFGGKRFVVCDACASYFHPKCVNHINKGVEGFTCGPCQMAGAVQHVPTQQPVPLGMSLVHDPTPHLVVLSEPHKQLIAAAAVAGRVDMPIVHHHM